MGLFDDLFGDLMEPIKDIAGVANEIRNDITESAGQIASDVAGLKEQGQNAISDLTGTVRGAVQDGQDIVRKK